MYSFNAKMQETNEKMKEEGGSKFNQFDERIMNMERKILDMDKKYEHRSEDNKQEHVNGNQGETVKLDSTVKRQSWKSYLLREMINEIEIHFGSTRIEYSAKTITHVFIHFVNDDERNKFIRSGNMMKKELRERKKITRSMDTEERFYNKRMGYIKYCIHTRHNFPISLISSNWTAKHVSVKGQIVVKTCQNGSLKFRTFQDIEDEVEEQMQKWQTKNSS